MNLIRALLLRIESGELPPGSTLANLRVTDSEVRIDGYTDNAIDYHLEFLIDSGLVDGSCNIERLFRINKLTRDGHDLVDSI